MFQFRGKLLSIWEIDENKIDLKNMATTLSTHRFDLSTETKPSIIKVIGVGGGGSNAVNNMYKLGIKDVSFIVCNTDEQALHNSPVPHKFQIGINLIIFAKSF